MYIRIRKPICFFLVTLVCRGRTTSINQPKCGSRKGVKHDLDVPTLTGGVKTKCLRVSLPRQGAACFMILAFCFCFPCLPAIVLVLPADVDHGWKVDAACQSASLDETAASDADAGN